jgi:hypothetical protein
MLLNLQKYSVLIRPSQVHPVTQPSNHDHSNASGRANIHSPITHVPEFGLRREWKNGAVVSSLATQHAPLSIYTLACTHTYSYSSFRIFGIKFRPPSLSFPHLFSVAPNKYKNSVSDCNSMPPFAVYHTH